MNIYNKPVLNFPPNGRSLSKGNNRFKKNRPGAKDNIKFQNQAGFSPNKSPTQWGKTAVSGVTATEHGNDFSD